MTRLKMPPKTPELTDEELEEAEEMMEWGVVAAMFGGGLIP